VRTVAILCELCGERPAKYVCQECGRRVCQYCFNTYYETCKDCLKSIGEHIELLSVEKSVNINWVLKSMIIGFIIIFLGMIIIAIASLMSLPEASGTFLIFIGPFPIIFGYGPYAPYLLIFGILVFFVLLFLFYYWHRR